MRSEKTEALIKGVKQMLKNRGSMTVKEVELLREVVAHLERHEELKGGEKLRNGIAVVEMLLRVLTNPTISETISQAASTLIEKLL